MILGELLQRVAGQAVDSGVADMKDMRGRRFDDQRAQRTDIALVPVVGVLAPPGLGVQPGIGRGQHAMRRGFHRPGFRGAVIVGQEALDRRFAGDLADIAAADAVRQHDGDAFQAEQRLVRDQGAVKILIDLLPAFVGMLPDRYLQFARHARTKKKEPYPSPGKAPLLRSNQARGRGSAPSRSRFGAVLTWVA